MDETLWCDHSNETSSAVLSHCTIYLVCSSNFWVCRWNPMVLPFKWNLLAVLSHGTIYLVCSSNFWVCGWNPMVWPFKWNLFSSAFTGCYLLFQNFTRWNLETLLDICFWLNLAVKGLNTGCLMDVELYLSLNQGDHIGASITDFKAVEGALL